MLSAWLYHSCAVFIKDASPACIHTPDNKLLLCEIFLLSGDCRKRQLKLLILSVNWIEQERLLGEDGQPRKVGEGEDVYSMGLVLEWVYGTIVSTAEKARDGAKRALGANFSSII